MPVDFNFNIATDRDVNGVLTLLLTSTNPLSPRSEDLDPFDIME